ncbi:DnaJ domain-containing protein [Crenobacter intestini]|uniref:DUF1311 domain-containing protein n=1 Tax=Crenobacter intestini TaxID=2563443 RepID=A0A4T0UPP8_9NEIS|nr:DnaJ domain-containing protein [Crenobacter intestini]TIC80315.1 DUF1311 domain-containing protein [Crenobacter intestini]
MQADPYQTLGVARDATDEQIRQAYRRAAMRWHPDRNPGRQAEAERRFKEIGAAYALLGDPARRAAYDAECRRTGASASWSGSQWQQGAKAQRQGPQQDDKQRQQGKQQRKAQPEPEPEPEPFFNEEDDEEVLRTEAWSLARLLLSQALSCEMIAGVLYGQGIPLAMAIEVARAACDEAARERGGAGRGPQSGRFAESAEWDDSSDEYWEETDRFASRPEPVPPAAPPPRKDRSGLLVLVVAVLVTAWGLQQLSSSEVPAEPPAAVQASTATALQEVSPPAAAPEAEQPDTLEPPAAAAWADDCPDCTTGRDAAPPAKVRQNAAMAGCTDAVCTDALESAASPLRRLADPPIKPSFDCRAARQPVEHRICASNELATLDQRMFAAYQALRPYADAEILRAEQRQWLRTRNACEEMACLRAAYQQRISQLEAGLP